MRTAVWAGVVVGEALLVVQALVDARTLLDGHRPTELATHLGYLVAAYTVLALAAGSRASVQLATKAGDAPVPYALSAVAAGVYLVLAVSLRRNGGWLTVAAVAATAELVGVLCVGTAERLRDTAWPDETVWSGYGIGYGFAPVLLPVVALVVLRTRRAAPHGRIEG